MIPPKITPPPLKAVPRLEFPRIRAIAYRPVPKSLRATKKRLAEEILLRRSLQRQLAHHWKHYNQLLLESEALQKEMKHLAHQVLSVQEEERKEISRELHDEIAQSLAGINIQLASLKSSASLTSRQLSRRIGITQRLVSASVDSVHKFARGLRPASLDDLGLVPALRSLLRVLPRRKSLRIQLRITEGFENLTYGQRTVLYRVAHEALTNVARHSGARNAVLSLSRSASHLHLTVEDDGRAFSPKRVLGSRSTRHLGILGMRERVEMAGGIFILTSSKGRGTRVSAEIPNAPLKPGKNL